MDRRQFVTAAGTAGVLASTSLAGCIGGVLDEAGVGDGNGGGSVSEGGTASFNAWVGAGTTVQNGRVSVASVGGETLRTDWGPARENQRIQDDALAMSVAEWGVPAGFAAGGATLVGLADPTTSGSRTDRFNLVRPTRVYEGEWDPARLRSAQELDRREEYGGYTLYEGEVLDSEMTAAVSADAVLYVRDQLDAVSDTTARIKSHIDASREEAARYATDHDAFADLQTALPVRGYSGVEFHPDGGVLEGESGYDFTTVQDADLNRDLLGYAGSTDTDGDDMTTSVALRYPSADEVDDRETIESELGAEADERAIEIDGSLVIVEGEYTDLSES